MERYDIALRVQVKSVCGDCGSILAGLEHHISKLLNRREYQQLMETTKK